MPLVKRRIKIVNDTTAMTEQYVDHTTYVLPGRVEKGDVIVKPMSDRQLAELAMLYPAEYGKEAEQRGVTPGAGVGRLAQLIALPAKDLIAQIAAMSTDTDSAILWALYEAELSEGDDETSTPAGKQRTTVLAALAEKGIRE